MTFKEKLKLFMEIERRNRERIEAWKARKGPGKPRGKKQAGNIGKNKKRK